MNYSAWKTLVLTFLLAINLAESSLVLHVHGKYTRRHTYIISLLKLIITATLHITSLSKNIIYHI